MKTPVLFSTTYRPAISAPTAWYLTDLGEGKGHEKTAGAFHEANFSTAESPFGLTRHH